jgi:hypothetical protein
MRRLDERRWHSTDEQGARNVAGELRGVRDHADAPKRIPETCRLREGLRALDVVEC